MIYLYLIPLLIFISQIYVAFSLGNKESANNLLYIISSIVLFCYIIWSIIDLQDKIDKSLSKKNKQMKPSFLFYFTALNIKNSKAFADTRLKKDEFPNFSKALENEIENGKLSRKDFELFPLVEKILNVKNFNLNIAHSILLDYFKNGSYLKIMENRQDYIRKLFAFSVVCCHVLYSIFFVIITKNLLAIFPYIIIFILLTVFIIFIENEINIFCSKYEYEDFVNYVENFSDNDELLYIDDSVNTVMYGLIYIKEKEDMDEDIFLTYIEEFMLEDFFEEKEW